MAITAALVVRNEEHRIEDCLRCLTWCDEIVVFDKLSDDRTREICHRYTDRIVTIPWIDFRPEENQYVIDHVQTEWVYGGTASDLITPALAKQIRTLIDQPDFPYDVIEVPYLGYVLGMDGPRSPWHFPHKPLVFRKRFFRFRSDSVHQAVYFDSNRIYQIPFSEPACVYHLTHESIDGLLDRHVRYCHTEAQRYPLDSSLWKPFLAIPRAFLGVLIRRRSWLMGWNGIALGFAYLTYSILRFLYIWEKRYSQAASKYQEIREHILCDLQQPPNG